MSFAFHLAQLRHLYSHMVNGRVKNTTEAARGLLGPAIEEFEQHQAELEALRAERDALRMERESCRCGGPK